MGNIISYNCFGCSGPIKFPDGKTPCEYCGTINVIDPGSGDVIPKLDQKLSRIEKSAKKTAAEMAIPRLRKDISDLEGEVLNLQGNITYRETNLREIDEQRKNHHIPTLESSGSQYIREKLYPTRAIALIGLVVFGLYAISQMMKFDDNIIFVPLLCVGFSIAFPIYIVMIGFGKNAKDKTAFNQQMKNYKLTQAQELKEYNDALIEANRLDEIDSAKINKLQDDIFSKNQELRNVLNIVESNY